MKLILPPLLISVILLFSCKNEEPKDEYYQKLIDNCNNEIKYSIEDFAYYNCEVLDNDSSSIILLNRLIENFEIAKTAIKKDEPNDSIIKLLRNINLKEFDLYIKSKEWLSEIDTTLVGKELELCITLQELKFVNRSINRLNKKRYCFDKMHVETFYSKDSFEVFFVPRLRTSNVKIEFLKNPSQEFTNLDWDTSKLKMVTYKNGTIKIKAGNAIIDSSGLLKFRTGANEFDYFPFDMSKQKN